ncbi:MAG TPA: DUF167 domain-containing protein [Blastocatellia bacterium]|nr:DUF167 domain-containing protein [Blastocatellia bacterium]
MLKFTTQSSNVTFSVRVQPRASKSEFVGEVEGALKIRLAAPPVDGAANEELISFLAKLLNVSRRQVSIISGATAKHKIIRVEGISGEQFEGAISQQL